MIPKILAETLDLAGQILAQKRGTSSAEAVQACRSEMYDFVELLEALAEAVSEDEGAAA
jgi:hypothetical protein